LSTLDHRVSETRLAEAVAKEVSSFWRLTHHHDLVPHVPLEYMGFYHCIGEVFFPSADPGNLTYIECDGSGEDPTCSNSCAATLQCVSVADHLLYVGFVLGSDNCGGSQGVVV